MKIYNSLSRKPETFKPPNESRVTMYVCGLTPYDSAHLGHARTYIAFDVIRRYLQKKSYSVFHIQNITDVEDKIIRRCMETGADPKKLTESMNAEAMELFEQLNILQADVYPKVTGHMPEIITFVEKLLKKGFAYETGTGIYFDVSKFADYGMLSGQKTEELKAGTRKEVDESKRNQADFALWKKSKGELLEFDSPWGRGRPGWHIECSALALKYGGETIDIHGGGGDLVFPHHENEKAQSEAANEKRFVRCWMHTGFLTANGEKMSKSLGNFITLAESMRRFSSNAHRLFFIQSHYRSPLNYDEEALKAAEESCERIFNSLGLMHEGGTEKKQKSKKDRDYREKSERLLADFYSAMDKDFDTPAALSALFSLLRLTNTQLEKPCIDYEQVKKVEAAVQKILLIIGLEEQKASIEDKKGALKKLAEEFGIHSAGKDVDTLIDLFIQEREAMRKNKDFKKADMVRERLAALGVLLEDNGGVTRWRVK